MINKNDIMQYRSKMKNLEDKLIWCAIKDKLSVYLESITDKKIDADIKWTIQSGYDTLDYYIDNEYNNTYSKGLSIKECIRDYYEQYKKEFNDIDIIAFLSHFEFTIELMGKIERLDCVQDFMKRFFDSGYKVSIFMSECDEEMILKVHLLDKNK